MNLVTRLLFVIILVFTSGLLYAGPLCDEITNDTETRGYSGMSVEAIAADLNTFMQDRIRTSVEGAELFEGITAGDWQLLSEAEKTQVISLLSFGTVKPSGNIKLFLTSMFGAGSLTIQNMTGIATEQISRAQLLGLGAVTAGKVQTACE